MVDKVALELLSVLLSRLSCIIPFIPSVQCHLKTTLTKTASG